MRFKERATRDRRYEEEELKRCTFKPETQANTTPPDRVEALALYEAGQQKLRSKTSEQEVSVLELIVRSVPFLQVVKSDPILF
jgi:hypothetical protein